MAKDNDFRRFSGPGLDSTDPEEIRSIMVIFNINWIFLNRQ